MALPLPAFLKSTLALFKPVLPVAVARAGCGFLPVELTGVPSAQRKQVLSNYLTRHIPVANFSSYTLSQGDIAAVWYWPKTDRTIDAFGLSSAVPESLFFSPPAADGWVAVACKQGYDLQHWQAGTVRSSHYCADDSALQQATESLGLAQVQRSQAIQLTPPPLVMRPMQQAWAWTRGAAASVALILLLMSYWGLQGLWFQVQAQGLNMANANLEQQLAPVVELRQKVSTLNAANQTIVSAAVPLLPLFGDVIAAFPADLPVRQVKFADNKLELRTVLDETVGPELIAKLEALPQVAQVMIDSGGGSGLAWVVLVLRPVT